MLRGEAVCQGREGAGCQGRRPFVKRGDCSPFVDRRMPFVHGRGPVVNGGGHSLKGETVCHLLTGGGRSSREGVFNVVGRKNNEIPHWEIQNST